MQCCINFHLFIYAAVWIVTDDEVGEWWGRVQRIKTSFQVVRIWYSEEWSLFRLLCQRLVLRGFCFLFMMMQNYHLLFYFTALFCCYCLALSQVSNTGLLQSERKKKTRTIDHLNTKVAQLNCGFCFVWKPRSSTDSSVLINRRVVIEACTKLFNDSSHWYPSWASRSLASLPHLWNSLPFCLFSYILRTKVPRSELCLRLHALSPCCALVPV